MAEMIHAGELKISPRSEGELFAGSALMRLLPLATRVWAAHAGQGCG